MEVMGNLRIVSYNCNGVKNKLPVITDLCNNSDVVLLQETWLLPCETNLLGFVHKDFCAFSLSAVDDQKLLVGRPYGGLSILWRRSLDSFCRLNKFDDHRIVGFNIETEFSSLFIINVYLPYYC